MASKDWYTITNRPDGNFRCLKVDEDHEPIQEYTIELGKTSLHCDCVAGLTGVYCRHKKMYNKFFADGKIGKGWYYSPDRNKWIEPTPSGDEG